jgi:HD-GYP domain-containing protein (c-di-GMP phosphodiesterase class II)
MITVSIGVTSYPADGESRERLISAADQALYTAKEAGRNMVYCFSDGLSIGASKDSKETIPETQKRRPQAKEAYARFHTAESTVGRLDQIRSNSVQVSRYALLLGEGLGLGEQGIESLRIASLLHDIGILAVPGAILHKAGKLTEDEQKIIQAHPGLAEMILRKAGQLHDILPAIVHHHERFDGTGYPDGLRGEEIPLMARILSVVDAYQAMISVRSYRERPSYQEVLNELRRHAGGQFDPHLVDLLIQVLEKEI